MGFFIVFRYFLIAGSFWWLYYYKKPNWTKFKQIHKTLPGPKIQKTEIMYSILTSLIFAFSGLFLGWLWESGYTKIYLKFTDYPLWYLPVSLLLISVIHDFYFYLSHRLLHHPYFYRRFHKVHHLSIAPSPWGSFSFHPVESIIEALPLPLIVLFIPVHPTMLILYLTMMTFSSVTNHLGFEVLPKSSGIENWWISGVHHTQHHKYFNYNYGLFYTWCDRLFKTQHSDFENDFKNLEKNR